MAYSKAKLKSNGVKASPCYWQNRKIYHRLQPEGIVLSSQNIPSLELSPESWQQNGKQYSKSTILKCNVRSLYGTFNIYNAWGHAPIPVAGLLQNKQSGKQSIWTLSMRNSTRFVTRPNTTKKYVPKSDSLAVHVSPDSYWRGALFSIRVMKVVIPTGAFRSFSKAFQAYAEMVASFQILTNSSIIRQFHAA
jgi:hypothetical protein